MAVLTAEGDRKSIFSGRYVRKGCACLFVCEYPVKCADDAPYRITKL